MAKPGEDVEWTSLRCERSTTRGVCMSKRILIVLSDWACWGYHTDAS